MEYLHECLENDIKLIEKAGLVPTGEHIETFSETLEEYGLGQDTKELHTLLQRFNELANVKSDYFLCRQTEMVDIASHLTGIDLSIVSTSNKFSIELMVMNVCCTAGQVPHVLVSYESRQQGIIKAHETIRIQASCWRSLWTKSGDHSKAPTKF